MHNTTNGSTGTPSAPDDRQEEAVGSSAICSSSSGLGSACAPVEPVATTAVLLRSSPLAVPVGLFFAADITSDPCQLSARLPDGVVLPERLQDLGVFEVLLDIDVPVHPLHFVVAQQLLFYIAAGEYPTSA